MPIDALVALLERELYEPAGSLRPDTRFEDVGGWNSMGIVTVLAELADHHGAELSADDVVACSTVADLHALVRAASA